MSGLNPPTPNHAHGTDGDISNYSGKGEAAVPDVVGALTGIRVWRIGDDGTLLGAFMPSPWGPGVNTAQCFHTERIRVHSVFGLGDTDGRPWFDKHGVPHLPTNWEWSRSCPGVARSNSGCGFYAATGNSKPRGITGDVVGVVEMWGNVEFGPLGLRASKARIVAVVDPFPDGDVQTPRIKEEWTQAHNEWLEVVHNPPMWYQAWSGRYLDWKVRKDKTLFRLKRLSDDYTHNRDAYKRYLKFREKYGHLAMFPTVDALLSEYPCPPLTDLWNE